MKTDFVMMNAFAGYKLELYLIDCISTFNIRVSDEL